MKEGIKGNIILLSQMKFLRKLAVLKREWWIRLKSYNWTMMQFCSLLTFLLKYWDVQYSQLCFMHTSFQRYTRTREKFCTTRVPMTPLSLCVSVFNRQNLQFQLLSLLFLYYVSLYFLFVSHMDWEGFFVFLLILWPVNVVTIIKHT